VYVDKGDSVNLVGAYLNAVSAACFYRTIPVSMPSVQHAAIETCDTQSSLSYECTVRLIRILEQHNFTSVGKL
jgi:hypothetical protein